MILPDGTILRQDYDGMRPNGALICDPDFIVLTTDDDGVITETYPGRSKTRQSDADSADINKILNRMSMQGIGPIFNPAEPKFLDITAVGDFRSALDQVRNANSYFMELDAEDRAKFNNDPAVFLDVVNDPVKLRALIDEGIIVDGSIVGGPVVPPVDEVSVALDREESLAVGRFERKSRRAKLDSTENK